MVSDSDQLLNKTAQWLVDCYQDKAEQPGWAIFRHGNNSQDTNDALTLQIYSLLLRAEIEAGFSVPQAILDNIPKHLARCAQRDQNSPNSKEDFIMEVKSILTGNILSPRVNLDLLWYPWAIYCSKMLLQHAERYNLRITIT